jgi:TetR/AcrR family transcriptional regulator, transcriptional repressor for nem operon
MSKATETRFSILQKSFELIYKKGYQATSIDDIIANIHVTKGAFYYHFKSKDEMGLAIINEILIPTMLDDFVTQLGNSENPLDDIYLIIKNLLFENPYLLIQYGCPVSNLVQEMTPWNEEFTKSLSTLIVQWQEVLENSIKTGIEKGLIRKNVNPNQVAYFLVSGYWGIRNFGKIQNNSECYVAYLKELKIYLDNLK